MGSSVLKRKSQTADFPSTPFFLRLIEARRLRRHSRFALPVTPITIDQADWRCATDSRGLLTRIFHSGCSSFAKRWNAETMPLSECCKSIRRFSLLPGLPPCRKYSTTRSEQSGFGRLITETLFKLRVSKWRTGQAQSTTAGRPNEKL